MGFVFTAVPVPPVRTVGQVQMGGLVFIVVHQILFDVLQNHGKFFCIFHFVQGHSEHRPGIYRQLVAVTIKIGSHLFLVDITID